MKQGPQYGHVPRCTCEECARAYLKHNDTTPCSCGECAMYREAWVPAARYMTPEEQDKHQQDTYAAARFGGYGYGSPATVQEKITNNSTYGKRQSMATINICSRPGCDSLIRGKAVGTIYIRVNANDEGERVEETEDYCPACIADVVALLDSEPLTERKRAYDKPYVRHTATDDAVESATDEQLAAVLFQRLMKQAQRQLPSTVDGSEE